MTCQQTVLTKRCLLTSAEVASVSAILALEQAALSLAIASSVSAG
jgi:hypothetical protein